MPVFVIQEYFYDVKSDALEQSMDFMDYNN